MWNICITSFFILLTLVSCLSEAESVPVIPEIPKEAIRKINSKWGIKPQSSGHVTVEEQKAPLLLFYSSKQLDTQEEVLCLYKKVYYEVAKAMSVTNGINDSSWESILFINRIPTAAIGLAFDHASETNKVFPKVVQISIGPYGSLGLSSIHPETGRYVKVGTSSLRELFKEELASDQMGPSAEE